MLLGSAALMGKSLMRVLSTDPGFRPQGALGAMVILPDARVAKDEAAVAIQGRSSARSAPSRGSPGSPGEPAPGHRQRQHAALRAGGPAEADGRRAGGGGARGRSRLLPGSRRATARGPRLRHRGRLRHPAGRGGQPRAPAPLLPRRRPGRQEHPTHLRPGRPGPHHHRRRGGPDLRRAGRGTPGDPVHLRRPVPLQSLRPRAPVEPRGGPGGGASRDPVGGTGRGRSPGALAHRGARAGSVDVPPAVPRLPARGLRRVCADPRRGGHLRRRLLRGRPADPRVRDSAWRSAPLGGTSSGWCFVRTWGRSPAAPWRESSARSCSPRSSAGSSSESRPPTRRSSSRW